MKEYLFPAIDQIYGDAVSLRRHLHANPELSGSEHKTARRIYDLLAAAGFSPRLCVEKTGVAVELTHGEGPTVVLRADTDALPITEKTGLPYKSIVPGVMHACGHDMHSACLFGAVNVLHRLRERWKGRIVCLFQPSEEVEPGGAARMIDEEVFPKDASAVFGLHVSTDHRVGQVGLKSGNDCSGVLVFDVTVHGRGGHGATPEKTIDPIVCASSMIMNLQTLISREIPPFEPAVLTVGSLHAGTKRNIIPDEAVFHGTIRTFSDRIQNLLKTRVGQLLKSVARTFRCEVDILFEKSYPSGFNDPKLVGRSSEVFRRILGTRNVVERQDPAMFAEDFASYQKIVPGVFAHLGVRPKGEREMPGIHSAGFNPDESSIRTGIAAHVAFALEILGNQ